RSSLVSRACNRSPGRFPQRTEAPAFLRSYCNDAPRPDPVACADQQPQAQGKLFAMEPMRNRGQENQRHSNAEEAEAEGIHPAAFGHAVVGLIDYRQKSHQRGQPPINRYLNKTVVCPRDSVEAVAPAIFVPPPFIKGARSYASHHI